MDLERAREIVAKSELWNLDDKLERAFDAPLGEIFWTLHKAAVLDCSQKDSWWHKMHAATEHYGAVEVADLLLRAGAQPEMGGLLDGFGRSELAWNIYCHLFFDHAQSDPAPLLEGYRNALEPMKTPWGLELVERGLMPVEELPDDAIERVATTAVTEVGGQSWYQRLLGIFGAERIAQPLLDAAAAPDACIWTLDFLDALAPFATPDQWARLTLNIDYEDTAPKMLLWLDRHPDGVEEALATQLGSHPPQRIGVATALAWAGPRAKARGEQLDGNWLTAALKAAESYDGRAVLAIGFDALDPAPREALLKGMFGQWRSPWELIGATVTPGLSQAAVNRVAAFKQSDLNDALQPLKVALAAHARVNPAPFVAALSSKKLRARELLAQALQDGTDPGAIPVLGTLLADSKEVVRIYALRGLVQRNAWEHLEELAKSRKKLVREAAEQGLAQLDPSAGPATDPLLERETVKKAETGRFGELMWEHRRNETMEAGMAAIREAFGERALPVVFASLSLRGYGADFTKRLFEGLLTEEPVEERRVAYAVAAVVHVTKDVSALQQYGDAVLPQVERLIEAGGEGLDWSWEILLRQGAWQPERHVHTVARGRGGRHRLIRALDVLGDVAQPGIEAALGDSRADVRLEAVEALRARPSADWVQLLDRQDRSAVVRDALAAARFACASIDAVPLAEEPDLDGRLAAFGGVLPKRIALPRDLLSWKHGGPLSEGAASWVWSRLGSGETDPDLEVVMERIQPDPPLWRRLMQGEKERWVILAGGWLGDASDMAALGDGLDDEARSGGATWAFYKVEALARNGTPPALRWLDRYARKAKSQGLKERAATALWRVAQERGVSADELADAVVGDLGVVDGTRSFPYGSRTVEVQIQPDGSVVFSIDSKVRKSLPKPLAADDAAEVSRDKDALRLFKSEVKGALEAATERLEQAMIRGRRWSAEGFAASWGGHALLRLLATRVWWASFGEEVVPLQLGGVGLESPEGLPWSGPIGVLHPLELAEDRRLVLPSLRSPFPQLGRRTAALQPEETKGTGLARFEDLKVGAGRLRGHLERRRWRRGDPQDGGAISWFSKYFERADVTAFAELDPGYAVVGWDDDDQSIPHVMFGSGDLGYLRDGLPLSGIDPIVISEVLADLELL